MSTHELQRIIITASLAAVMSKEKVKMIRNIPYLRSMSLDFLQFRKRAEKPLLKYVLCKGFTTCLRG